MAYEPPELDHEHALSRAGPMAVRLSEAEWTTLVRMFRACLPRRGGKGRDDRRFLQALLHCNAHNLSWRALPKEFGNWNSIWKRYWRLSKAEVLEDFIDSLKASGRTAHLAQLFDAHSRRVTYPER
jgi:transposase